MSITCAIIRHNIDWKFVTPCHFIGVEVDSPERRPLNDLSVVAKFQHARICCAKDKNIVIVCWLSFDDRSHQQTIRSRIDRHVFGRRRRSSADLLGDLTVNGKISILMRGHIHSGFQMTSHSTHSDRLNVKVWIWNQLWIGVRWTADEFNRW